MAVSVTVAMSVAVAVAVAVGLSVGCGLWLLAVGSFLISKYLAYQKLSSWELCSCSHNHLLGDELAARSPSNCAPLPPRPMGHRPVVKQLKTKHGSHAEISATV